MSLIPAYTMELYLLDLTNKNTSYRKDRGTPGGGLITYVKTAIPSSRLFDMEEEGKVT